MEMDKEILEIESYPDGGFERFTHGSVMVTDETVALGPGALDRKAKKMIRQYTKGPYEPVKGIAQVSWKSAEDREKCIENQKRRSRWAKVEKYADLMRQGQWDYSKPDPVFLHPSLVGPEARQLKSANGARRIMAHLELQHETIDVIILRQVETDEKEP